jgi:hypothetical protein
MVRGMGVIALCALLSFLLVGVESEDTSAHANAELQQTLDAITSASFDPKNPLAAFPEDWQVRMGYNPVVATGPESTPILIKPMGDCSAFSGETTYGFGAVCKEHDLAYDVLRYSAKTDQPLPAAARQQADAMFDREMHAQCAGRNGFDGLICHGWATSFAKTVDFNSWRQGFRPPRIGEQPGRWDAMVLLFVVLLLARRWHELLGRDLDPHDLRRIRYASAALRVRKPASV